MKSKREKSKTDKKLRVLKIVLWVAVGLLLIDGYFYFVNSWMYLDVALPAYLSMQTTCNVESQNIADFQAYAQQNNFIVRGAYDPNTDQIIIIGNESEEPDPSIIRHEECHRRQHEEHRAHACNYKLFLWMDEVECYLKQRG